MKFNFGKYKGRTIEEIAIIDWEYLQWIKEQAWFKKKCSFMIRIINAQTRRVEKRQNQVKILGYKAKRRANKEIVNVLENEVVQELSTSLDTKREMILADFENGKSIKELAAEYQLSISDIKQIVKTV